MQRVQRQSETRSKVPVENNGMVTVWHRTTVYCRLCGVLIDKMARRSIKVRSGLGRDSKLMIMTVVPRCCGRFKVTVRDLVKLAELWSGGPFPLRLGLTVCEGSQIKVTRETVAGRELVISCLPAVRHCTAQHRNEW